MGETSASAMAALLKRVVPQFKGESRQLESLALPYLLPRRPKYTRLPEIEKVRRDDPRDRPFETRYSTTAS
jgi:hypothetical protein